MGVRNAKGEAGPIGPTGQRGPVGPSEAFYDTFGNVAVPQQGFAQPYARTFGPGSYVFHATFRAVATSGATNAGCSIAAGDQGIHQQNIDLDATEDRKTVTLLAAATLDAETEVSIACDTPGGAAYAIDSGSVVVIRVGSVQ